jgi:iron only hydrogenase large subunit-like protein
MTNNQSSVVLDNVDDYLAPSQACINPMFQPPEENSEKAAMKDAERTNTAVVVPRRRRRVVRRSIDLESHTNEDKKEEDMVSSGHEPSSVSNSNGKQAVTATIADCLACSGCVTTAETVLLEQHHSLTSLRKRLDDDDNDNDATQGRKRAITLSPNSIADLCRHWNLSMDRRPVLATILNRVLGANLVIDGNIPLEWAWQEEAQEFVESYRQKRVTTTNSTAHTSPPPPSTAVDATRTLYYLPNGTTATVTHSITTQGGVDDATASNLDYAGVPLQNHPLISGSCPALVCLVEKSMHNLVPNLSQSLSPMSRMGWELQDWDHWAIMPCHDKKLEASRKDFEWNGKKAVDLVITTTELVELLEEWQQTTNDDATAGSMKEYFEKLPLSPGWTSSQWSMTGLEQELVKHPVLFWSSPSSVQMASSISTATFTEEHQLAYNSGGHADFIFRYAARELFNVDIEHVQWNTSGVVSSNHGTIIKSVRLASLQKKQQSYQACLYQASDGSYTQDSSTDNHHNYTLVLKFGIVRGMQTMQRALKDLDPTLDYLEAMACPHGCVNGGGSVRSTHNSNRVSGTVLVKETPTETKLRVDRTLEYLVVPTNKAPSTFQGPRYQTRYHVVPPMHHTMGAAAGVKVNDMQW